ncbi:MAG: serine/threonine-protein phosphatase [Oscillospiraceae bacterium]|nr:serine/threonine-protein phosphatase [Oscillospiraceae bacterium]
MDTDMTKGLTNIKNNLATADLAVPWETGFAENIGTREQQQDRAGIAVGTYCGKTALLAVLADGMGGMKDGAEYARITVDSHLKHFQEALDRGGKASDALLFLALKANEEAYSIHDEDSPGGSTLVSALFVDEDVYILSVGDSRIYLFRMNEELGRYVPLLLNREHVLGAALDEQAWMGKIDMEDAEDSIYRNTLSSCIGMEKIRRLDLTETPIRLLPGDRIGLMSDGVFKTLSSDIIAQTMDEDPETTALRIVERVLQEKAPKQDNMSILIVDSKKQAAEAVEEEETAEEARDGEEQNG